MQNVARFPWFVLAAAAVAVGGMLVFQQTTTAQQRGANPPFANAVEQRAETIARLKAIEDLLREQNELLRSGQIKVVVVQPQQP